MRNFKFVLILTVVSFLTIGIYGWFIHSMDESEFVIETVKGDPKQQAVQSIQAEILDRGLKPMDYEVTLNGRVQKTTLDFVDQLFKNPFDIIDAPLAFRRFIAPNSVNTLEQYGIVYAMRLQKEGRWELQYFNQKKQRLFKKIVSAPAGIKYKGEVQFSPFQRSGDNLYVYVVDEDPTNVGDHFFKFDLKADTIQKVDLPKTSNEYFNVLGINGEKIVYQTEGDINGSDATKRNTYISDGKTVQSLTALDSIDLYQSELIEDGKKLVALIDDADQENFKWIVYDIGSKKLTHQSNDFNKWQGADGSSTYFRLENGVIYTGLNTGIGIFNVQVIDPLSGNVIYEGNIKDRLKRQDIILNGLVVK